MTEVNENTKEVPKALLAHKHTREAVGYMEKAAYTKEQLEAYDRWKIAAMTERSALKDAKKEGLVEGEATGIAKGEVIGIAKGVEKEKVETVIRMYKKGKSVEDISDATDLSPQQINELIKQYKK